MKQEFEMTQEELAEIHEIGSHPVMFLSGGEPMYDHRFYANQFWQKLGKKYNFQWDSCEPISGKPHQFFKATPNTQQNAPVSDTTEAK